ncbi:hypothetical protein ABIA00_002494 [Bradyrhizobium ottawaense]
MGMALIDQSVHFESRLFPVYWPFPGLAGLNQSRKPKGPDMRKVRGPAIPPNEAGLKVP